MNKKKLNASSVRLLLIIIMFILTVFIVGGFIFAYSWLAGFADSVNKTTSSVGVEMTPKELNETQSALFKNQSSIEKAASIAASTRDYNSKIQQDINRYATSSGIKVTDFGPASSPSGSSGSSLVAGVQASYVSITLQNPINYEGLIKFINAIETNIPKMKLAGISIKRIQTPKGHINVDPITIEIYLR